MGWYYAEVMKVYAGSPSYYRFREYSTTHYYSMTNVIPTHQGRASEKILFSIIGWQRKIYF
ncbi:MAG: hypothetical protein V9E96_11475 [Chitinophagaceae bacterium]